MGAYKMRRVASSYDKKYKSFLPLFRTIKGKGGNLHDSVQNLPKAAKGVLEDPIFEQLQALLAQKKQEEQGNNQCKMALGGNAHTFLLPLLHKKALQGFCVQDAQGKVDLANAHLYCVMHSVKPRPGDESRACVTSDTGLVNILHITNQTVQLRSPSGQKSTLLVSFLKVVACSNEPSQRIHVATQDLGQSTGYSEKQAFHIGFREGMREQCTATSKSASTNAPTTAPPMPAPTEVPSNMPTQAPSNAPTHAPSNAPTETPTSAASSGNDRACANRKLIYKCHNSKTNKDCTAQEEATAGMGI